MSKPSPLLKEDKVLSSSDGEAESELDNAIRKVVTIKVNQQLWGKKIPAAFTEWRPLVINVGFPRKHTPWRCHVHYNTRDRAVWSCVSLVLRSHLREMPQDRPVDDREDFWSSL
jgi:hypothetical protein